MGLLRRILLVHLAHLKTSELLWSETPTSAEHIRKHHLTLSGRNHTTAQRFSRIMSYVFRYVNKPFFLKETTRGLWHPVTLKPKIGKIGILQSLQRSKTKTKKTTILFPLLRWRHVSRKIGPCARLWYGPGPHWHRGPGDIRVAQWFTHLVTW